MDSQPNERSSVMKFSVCVKSGTSGHSDYDKCDLVLAVITGGPVPNKGDMLRIPAKDPEFRGNLLVTEVLRSYLEASSGAWNEFVTVYVIKY
jgi:hypothetical protein